MTYLIVQIVLCLLLAALFGFFIGWALRGLSCSKQLDALEAEWTEKLAAAAAAGAGQKRDDLRIIEGIGPKIEQLLNEDRIFTFADLAAADSDRLRSILRRAGDRFKMHNPKTWPDQAKLAAEGRWDELDELQNTLLGGRDS